MWKITDEGQSSALLRLTDAFETRKRVLLLAVQSINCMVRYSISHAVRRVSVVSSSCAAENGESTSSRVSVWIACAAQSEPAVWLPANTGWAPSVVWSSRLLRMTLASAMVIGF